jgi:hypothetical protein
MLLELMMKRVLWSLWILLCVAALTTNCDSGYRKATVIKMATIPMPQNLADVEECRTLWSDIQRYGIDMDNLRKDWNNVVLGAAFQLIERGCVKSRHGNQ